MALGNGKTKRVTLALDVEIKGRETAVDAARDVEVMLYELTHTDDRWKELVLYYKVRPARRSHK